MQTIPDIELLHEAADATWLESDNGHSATLNVCFSENYLIGSFFDRREQAFVMVKSFEAKTKNTSWLPDKELIERCFPNKLYGKINIFVPGLKLLLVPEALYREEVKTELFLMNHKLDDGEKVYNSALKRLQAKILYAYPEKKMRELERQFSGAGIFHVSCGYIESLQMQYREEEAPHFHIDITEKGIMVSAFMDGRLQFFNTFPAETPEDKLYFITFVSEQLSFSPLRDNYYVSGIIDKLSDDYNLFKTYIKNLHLQPRPPFNKYSLPLLRLPEPFYYKAFSTALCE